MIQTEKGVPLDRPPSHLGLATSLDSELVRIDFAAFVVLTSARTSLTTMGCSLKSSPKLTTIQAQPIGIVDYAAPCVLGCIA